MISEVFIRFWGLVSFLFIFICTSAQELSAQQELILHERLELIARQNQSSNIDFSLFLDRLYDYLQTPLDLNNTTAEELQNLGLLSSQQIESILYQRVKYGDYQTIYELIFIPYFDPLTVELIAPFLTCKTVISTLPGIKTLLKKSRHQILWRTGRTIQSLQGAENNDFLGDVNLYYLRYRMQSMRQLSFGFTLEKDVGEKAFSSQSPHLFDFQSMHLLYRPKKVIHTIVLGDYQIRHGQGLNIWTGFTSGNAPNPAKLSRYANTINAYTSANEYNFLRGAALTLAPTSWIKSTLFYSSRKVDATVEQDSNNSEIEINIRENGWHRTKKELDNKGQLKLGVYGGILETELKTAKIGLSVVSGVYEPNENHNSLPYQLNDWNGKRFTNVGINFSTQLPQWHLFGELVTTVGAGNALILGSEWSLHPRLTTSLQYRSYQENYNAFFASANGQNGNNTNENGLYLGVQFLLSKRMQLSLYADLYSFQWLKYRTDAPSNGEETWAQLNIDFSKNHQGTIRFRRKSVSYNRTITANKAVLNPIVVQQLRFNFLQSSNGPWSTAFRIEASLASTTQELGFVGYQDFKYKHEIWGMGMRFLYFNVPDYYGRIYTYENDILYYFYIPAFNGQGSRMYINMNCKLSQSLKIYGKLGHTIYTDRTEIGSGLNTIKGRNKTDVRLQLQLKF